MRVAMRTISGGQLRVLPSDGSGHLLPRLGACPPFHAQGTEGRSTKLLRQPPVKPKVGAACGSENQNLVNAETFGAQNQWAEPSSSTAHQRAPFGAWDQSTFMALGYCGRGKAANRFSLPLTEVVNQIRTISREHVPHPRLQPFQNILHFP